MGQLRLQAAVLADGASRLCTHRVCLVQPHHIHKASLLKQPSVLLQLSEREGRHTRMRAAERQGTSWAGSQTEREVHPCRSTAHPLLAAPHLHRLEVVAAALNVAAEAIGGLVGAAAVVGDQQPPTRLEHLEQPAGGTGSGSDSGSGSGSGQGVPSWEWEQARQLPPHYSKPQVASSLAASHLSSAYT